MSSNRGPVIVELTCEASPSTDTQTIDRDEWDNMTPAQRAELINDMAATHVTNSGGYGWFIADPDDEAAVGTAPTLAPVDTDAVMELVYAYGHACRSKASFGKLTELTDQIRGMLDGKGR